jgi:phage shock protein E
MSYMNYALAALGIGFLILKLVRSNTVKNQIKNLVSSNQKFTLLDVRTKDEFVSGSVQGAINIPVADLDNRAKELENKENIIVFCKSGMRAGQAKSFLRGLGHQNIINGGSWVSVAGLVG